MFLERTLVLIRERSYLDLLDLGLSVVRRRPLVLGLCLVLGALPFALLNSWLLGHLAAADDSFPIPIAWFWLVGWEAPWATAPLTVVLGGMMFGERPKVRAVLWSLTRGIVPMVLYQGLLRPILMVVWFLAPLLFAKLPFLNEVILLEHGSWGSVLSRCQTLTRSRAGVFLGRWLFQLGLGLLFLLAFVYGASNLVDMVVLQREPLWIEPDRIVLTEWPAQVGTWLVVGFFGVVRFLNYIDQRIRLEGWELELRMRALGKSLEDQERW